MTNKDISSLIIVDKSDAPVGIVSERDIVRKCCSREDLDIKLATVSEIMSSPVITINHKSSPREVAELLVRTINYYDKLQEHHSKVIRISPVSTDWPSQTLIPLIRPFA